MSELGEKIAQWLAKRFVYGRDNEFNPLNYYGLSQNEKEDVNRDANRIITLIRSEGYVKLAEDQSLAPTLAYHLGLIDLNLESLHKAGFRRVEIANEKQTLTSADQRPAWLRGQESAWTQ